MRMLWRLCLVPVWGLLLQSPPPQTTDRRWWHRQPSDVRRVRVVALGRTLPIEGRRTRYWWSSDHDWRQNMKRHATSLGHALLIAASFALLAATAHAAEGKYAEIVLSAEKDGPAKEVFATTTPKIHLRAKLVDMRRGTKLKSVWIAEKTKVAPPNGGLAEYSTDRTNHRLPSCRLNSHIVRVPTSLRSRPPHDFRPVVAPLQCAALQLQCTHWEDSLHGRSDHRPSARAVGSYAQANVTPPGTPALARRPHGTRGVPSGSTVSRP